MAVTTRKLHKWISVGTGVFLFSWLVTGLVMITNNTVGGLSGQGTRPTIDWSVAAVAPARAGEVAVASMPGASVRSVELTRLRDGAAYLVRLTPAGQVLVDAASGARIVITPELASGIAADRLPGLTVQNVERLERHGPGYRRGPLPVYRVRFGDGAGTQAIVNAETGAVDRDWRRLRAMRFIGSLHEFMPLQPYSPRLRIALLWVTSLAAAAGVLTGYWLSLPVAWQRRAATWGGRSGTPAGP